MKILIDGRFYGLEHAGLGRYTKNLIDSLAKIDHQNEYVVLLASPYFNKLKYPNNFTKIKADFPRYSFSEQIKLPLILAREKADVVHFPHFNVPIFWWGKFMVTIHDLLMHKFKGKETTNLPFFAYPIKRLGYYIAFSVAVLRARKIIVPTKFVKKDLLATYKIKKEKVFPIYEGFEKIKKASSWETTLAKYKIRKPYLIYTGNSYPHKNIDRAIDAFCRVNKERKEKINFYIVSARSVFTKRMLSQIKAKKASSFVHLLGFVEDADLVPLYAHSLGFIYPSLSEGFGLQGLEVMAAGGLLLASNIPTFKEVFGENAFYFDPKKEEEIVKAILKAESIGEKEKEKRIKKAKDFIKRYSWEKMAKETLALYKSSEENE